MGEKPLKSASKGCTVALTKAPVANKLAKTGLVRGVDRERARKKNRRNIRGISRILPRTKTGSETAAGKFICDRCLSESKCDAVATIALLSSNYPSSDRKSVVASPNGLFLNASVPLTPSLFGYRQIRSTNSYVQFD